MGTEDEKMEKANVSKSFKKLDYEGEEEGDSHRVGRIPTDF